MDIVIGFTATRQTDARGRGRAVRRFRQADPGTWSCVWRGWVRGAAPTCTAGADRRGQPGREAAVLKTGHVSCLACMIPISCADLGTHSAW